MFKGVLHVVIATFFKRLSNNMDLEHYEFKVNVHSKTEKVHVMITKKYQSDEQCDMDLAKYIK